MEENRFTLWRVIYNAPKDVFSPSSLYIEERADS